MTPLRIWSKRWSIAKGWHFVAERIISDDSTIQRWLEVFQTDEPSVDFFVSREEPKF